MSLRYKASLLAIGTEVTSGEINNTNVQWLAEKLEALGFDVVLHMAVPDDRPAMYSALDYATSQSAVIFVTGGLGPTTDDFTREVVSHWAGDLLEFRQDAWDFLEDSSKRRGLRLRPAHRQQCHFPAHSKTLKNFSGTAHGFYLTKGESHCFVLPGPPREIMSMWEPSVLPWLENLQPKTSSQLYRWVCFSIPESEVAEVVEDCLAGSGLKTGYRASLPYVHVKVWVPSEVDAKKHLEKLDSLLRPWVVFEGEDALEDWLKHTGKFDEVEVTDRVTYGLLAQRLSQCSGSDRRFELFSSWGKNSSANPSRVRFAVANISQDSNQDDPGRTDQDRKGENQKDTGHAAQYRFTVTVADQEKSQIVSLPFKLKPDSARARAFLVEQALITWLQLLKELNETSQFRA